MPPPRRVRSFSLAEKGLFGVLGVLLAVVAVVVVQSGLRSGGTSSTSASTSPSPFVVEAGGAGTAEAAVPIESAEADEGTWVMQLAAVEEGDEEQLEAQHEAATEATGQVKVVRSSELPVWTPGYWVIYQTGTFADGRDVLERCREIGREIPEDCLGRYVSDDPADLGPGCGVDMSDAACTRSSSGDAE